MKAEQQSGRERLGMEAFARALEAIPSTLLDNAGTKARWITQTKIKTS